MDTRLIDVDPLTGTRSYVHYDPTENTFTYEDVQDVTALVEENKRRHNETTDAHWKGDMHLVASLPLQIWFKLKKEGILNDQRALRRWLNDPDNALFRTRPGRV